MTVSHGRSAWLWKITARLRLGPSIASLSTITAPCEGTSSPARMLSTVVLPQPEWPMMQTNSPRAIASHRSSNTVVLPPPGAGKRLVMPSIEMNFSVMSLHGTAERTAMPSCSSLRKRHDPGGAREDLVEDHADDTDHQDRGDHVGDRE